LAALARSLRPERGGLDLAQRNRTGLEALAQCSDPATRVVLRNALVHQNLPLVGAIASRLGRSQGLPQEDLYQIASLGLLRAIEAFRPERGRSLSSFAVPYIRGAIQHELRDRSSLVRIPRELWELRRQVTVLQESQRHQGGVALAAPQLAAALGCRVDRVVEALSLHTVTEMASLDAPLRSGEEAACGSSLLESLADPASLAASDAEGPEGCTSAEAGWRSAAALAHGAEGPTARSNHDGRADAAAAASGAPPATAAEPSGSTDLGGSDLAWLRQCLAQLQPQQRQLLVGHVCLGSSWVELGRELNLHPRQAQRLTLALLSRLRDEGRLWRAAQRSPAADRGD
jgi:RNA polymerase sigma-B factor